MIRHAVALQQCMSCCMTQSHAPASVSSGHGLPPFHASLSSSVKLHCFLQFCSVLFNLRAHSAMAELSNNPPLWTFLLLLVIPLGVISVPVCNPWLSSESKVDICQDPSFDAAVSVSDSQMLLFKGANMWLLDLLNYQVSQPLSNCIFKSCVGTYNGAGGDFLINSYYVWNQHERLQLHKNRICVQGAGKICQFAVDLRPTPNDIFYRNDLNSAPFDVWNGTSEHGKTSCQQNVYGDQENTIEIVLIQKNFYQFRGARHVWLIGRQFKAYVSYTPNPYDLNVLFLKTELFKLYQEVERVQADGASSSSPSVNETSSEFIAAEQNQIENVNTFAVLPTGELMVFFADHFCHINYYDLECKRRSSTSALIGCTMPTQDMSRNQLYIAPDRVNSSLPSTPTASSSSPAQAHERHQPDEREDASQTSTGAISNVSSLNPTTSWTTTVSTREDVNNESNSSSVSTLPIAARDTATMAPVTRQSSSTRTSSSSLSALSSSTSVHTQTAMSRDTNWTSFLSATATTRTGTTTDSNHSTSPGQYDIDFLYRKRDTLKRSLAHDPTEKQFGNLRRHFNFLQIGFASLEDITIRAFKIFIVSFAVAHLLAVLILSLVHRYRKIDFTVLMYIYSLSLGRALNEL